MSKKARRVGIEIAHLLRRKTEINGEMERLLYEMKEFIRRRGEEPFDLTCINFVRHAIRLFELAEKKKEMKKMRKKGE